ncbi:hypothetical protein GLYMA_04G132351v4 [Glycine max]|nr:hypothetical protein GLYMA_04G132351v4 [Glycine max]KAH1111186.1 hypothetical protein GYH30_009809 [Glycine max]
MKVWFCCWLFSFGCKLGRGGRKDQILDHLVIHTLMPCQESITFKYSNSCFIFVKVLCIVAVCRKLYCGDNCIV